MGMLFIGGTDADSIPVSGLELTPENTLAQQGQRLVGVSGIDSGVDHVSSSSKDDYYTIH